MKIKIINLKVVSLLLAVAYAIGFKVNSIPAGLNTRNELISLNDQRTADVPVLVSLDSSTDGKRLRMTKTEGNINDLSKTELVGGVIDSERQGIKNQCIGSKVSSQKYDVDKFKMDSKLCKGNWQFRFDNGGSLILENIYSKIVVWKANPSRMVQYGSYKEYSPFDPYDPNNNGNNNGNNNNNQDKENSYNSDLDDLQNDSTNSTEIDYQISTENDMKTDTSIPNGNPKPSIYKKKSGCKKKKKKSLVSFLETKFLKKNNIELSAQETQTQNNNNNFNNNGNNGINNNDNGNSMSCVNYFNNINNNMTRNNIIGSGTNIGNINRNNSCDDENMKFILSNTGSFRILNCNCEEVFYYNENLFDRDIYFLSVEEYGDYGNLVVRNPNQNRVWSAISHNLQSNESDNQRSILPISKYLLSNNGKYRLEMQSNGELAIINNKDRYYIWISPNQETLATDAQILNDGTLVILNNGVRVWASIPITNGTAPFTLSLRDDANLVIEDSTSTLIWESKTSRSLKYPLLYAK